jgi:hypothetical protein
MRVHLPTEMRSRPFENMGRHYPSPIAQAAFSDSEIVDMTYSIGAWMVNGRALHVLGMDSVCLFVLPERVLA